MKIPKLPFRPLLASIFAVAISTGVSDPISRLAAQDANVILRPLRDSSANEIPARMLTPARTSKRPQTDHRQQTVTVSLPPASTGETFVSNAQPSGPESGGSPDILDQPIGVAGEPNETQGPIAAFGLDQSKPILKVVGGLGVVIAIFFAFTLLTRRSGGKANGKVPNEVFEVVGQMPLDARRQFQLVRFGGKLLLLSVGDKTVQTVSEIVDPVEVEHVLSLLHRGRAADAFATFRRNTSQIRQQRRTQRMYPSQFGPEADAVESAARMSSHNVFEA